LIAAVLLLLVGCAEPRHPGVSSDFSYPELGETVEITDPIEVQRLAGRVTDETGAPIAGALVELRSGDGSSRLAATFSNANGDFSFIGGRTGVHHVKVTKPNFAPLRATLKIVRSGARRASLRMRIAT
jgi:hypothetical protein